MRDYLAAHNYQQIRRERPNIPAMVVWNYVNGEYPEAQNVDQAMCRHEWAINGESDRCYCMNCGMDGDA